MVEQLDTFVLKLLSASKEVGLRRLRSYAASLGGGAQIFREVEKLIQSLEEGTGGLPQIVVADGTVQVSEAARARIERSGRLFLLESPEQVAARGAGEGRTDSACWRAETYMQCSLTTFLDSPVVRISMSQLCPEKEPFHFKNLMRWGHAAQTWKASGDGEIAEAGLTFIRDFNLVSEWRRVTEMFCHFAEARLGPLGLVADTVHFASDGLLLTGIATCRTPHAVGPEARARLLATLATELRIFRFPISGINQLPDGRIEVAAFHCPVHRVKEEGEACVLVFHKHFGRAFSASGDQAEEKKAG